MGAQLDLFGTSARPLERGPWFSKTPPRGALFIGVPCGAAIFNLHEGADADFLPRGHCKRRRPNDWRKISKEPGFWALPAYNKLQELNRPVVASELTIPLADTEPISDMGMTIVRALFRLVEHDWACWRPVVDAATDVVVAIEWTWWHEDIRGVRMLRPRSADDA